MGYGNYRITAYVGDKILLEKYFESVTIDDSDNMLTVTDKKGRVVLTVSTHCATVVAELEENTGI
ncbi:MAG: hypothetical protein K2H29_09540 [Oscillospiraceae bacterium]|nr:hypothetical protein [Oscillospiraceae bacterium]MDE5885299.1 hypothetical protein [Oscillospiraceae bacterium]